MKLRLLKQFRLRLADFAVWNQCPLCGGCGRDIATLQRRQYQFGQSLIPIPDSGVTLRECQHCTLLFKTLVPTAESLGAILRAEAANEWKEKTGDHPSKVHLLELIRDEQLSAVLDIGASNGDLLRALRTACDRLSAFDVVRFPKCEDIVNGEYITGTFENTPSWSGEHYDLVTAFDVFEHFLDPCSAARNIIHFARNGGFIIVETGDWQAVRNDLAGWYYCNLFEHQIFWSENSFRYLASEAGLRIKSLQRVNHKFRRNMPALKKAATITYRQLARNGYIREAATRSLGVDPSLVPPPDLVDHLYVVLQRR